MLPAQVLLALAARAGAGATRAALGLLARPCPDLLDVPLLLAGNGPELTGTGVGEAVTAAHWAGRGVLTPGAHTAPSRAHGPEGTHRVTTGLAVSGRGHVQADLVAAGVDVQLALTGVRAPIRATHRLGRGDTPRGADTASCLSLTQGSKATLPAAVTRSSACHPDLPLQGTGRGLQLTGAAIGDTVTATHGVVDARAGLLALTYGCPVLHGAGSPERTLHPVTWGQGLITGALVLDGDGPLLPTLSLLAPALAVIRVPVLATHGPVGPVAGHSVTGAAGTATA